MLCFGNDHLSLSAVSRRRGGHRSTCPERYGSAATAGRGGNVNGMAGADNHRAVGQRVSALVPVLLPTWCMSDFSGGA